MKYKPEYDLGDRVSFDDKLWYICGIQLHTGYNLILWEYKLSSHYFGDTPDCGWEYVEYSKMWLRPEQLKTVEEWVKNQRKKLEDKKASLEKQIENIESQLKGK